MSAIEVSGLKIQPALYNLVQNEVIPNTGIEAAHFWASLADLVATLGPENQAMLDKRVTLQKKCISFSIVNAPSSFLRFCWLSPACVCLSELLQFAKA